MTIRAYAKINLDLRLQPRRADGYHPIDTFMIRVKVADLLSAEKTNDGKISLTIEGDEQLSAGADNLVLRAARALQAKAAPEMGARLHLTKNIPQGAGLGGGSSDAAATLLLLQKLWSVSLSGEELSKIGGQLGSDVPFFIQPHPARAHGRGEILEPVPLTHLPWAVLVHPGFASPTASAYAAYAMNPIPGQEGSPLTLRKKDGSALRIVPRNDLEPAVESKFLWIRTARDWLSQKEGVLVSRMSGSGSTVFALLSTAKQAKSLAEKAREYFGKEAWIQATQLGDEET